MATSLVLFDNTEVEEMEISDEEMEISDEEMEMEMEMDDSESDCDESHYDESEDEYKYEDEEYVASLQASLDNMGDIEVLSEDMSMTRILDIIRARQLRGTMELELMVRKKMEITADKLDEIQGRGYVPCGYADFIRNEYPVIRSSLPPYKPKKGNYLYKEYDRLRFSPKTTTYQGSGKTNSKEKRRKKKKVTVARSLFKNNMLSYSDSVSSSPVSTCTSESGNSIKHIGTGIYSAPLTTLGVVGGSDSGGISSGGSSCISSGSAVATPYHNNTTNLGAIGGGNLGGSSRSGSGGSRVVSSVGSNNISSGVSSSISSGVSSSISSDSATATPYNNNTTNFGAISGSYSVGSGGGGRVISSGGGGSIISAESATSTPYNNNFENDPPIYLQVLFGNFADHDDDCYAWHVIKPGNFTPQDTFLGNILPTQPKIGDHTQSVSVSVGSRIYLIGGFDPSLPGMGSPKSLKDFYYSDTTSCGQGRKWNKGPSLPKPIAFPFAVVLNNNNNGGADIGNQVKENLSTDKDIENRGDLLLVAGSYGPLFDPKNNSVQAYVLEEGGSVWRSLNTVIPPKLTGQVTGHVVHRLGGTKHMLVYSSDSPDLYDYDFESGNWALACKDFGRFQKVSALVGSILYTMDSQNPGYIFALDTSSSESLQKRIPVELDYPEDKRWWVPQRDKHGYLPASFFMVPLGNHKLAIIWYYKPQSRNVKGKSRNVLVIWCTRWEVFKVDSTNGLFKLKAYSRARYFSDATVLVNCLPTVQSQRTESPDGVAEFGGKGVSEMKH